jgi:hypothetical protein
MAIGDETWPLRPSVSSGAAWNGPLQLSPRLAQLSRPPDGRAACAGKPGLLLRRRRRRPARELISTSTAALVDQIAAEFCVNWPFSVGAGFKASVALVLSQYTGPWVASKRKE